MNERENQIALPKKELVDQFWAERNAFFGYIHRFGFDRDTVMDIFQEACMKFMKATANFESFPPAAKYLYRIIFNLSVSCLRSQGRLIYSDKLPERICEPEPEWQKELMIESVRQAASNLSSRDRQLLEVHLKIGPQLQEKSEMMQMPLSTYRYQVVRVISKLKKQLAIKPWLAGNSSQIGGN